MAHRPRTYGLILTFWLAAVPSVAETLRLAIYNTALSRDYAGHLIRDVERRDPQVVAIADVIAAARPDIILLTEFDHDPQNRALAGMQALLAERGLDYPTAYASTVNTGEQTGRDMDGDGRLNEPEDAHSYALWPGHRGMAMLSNRPLTEVRTFRTTLWADQPDNRLTVDERDAFGDIQRLPARAFWILRFPLLSGEIHIVAAHLQSPVFDGPDDRNGRRNADEIDWLRRLLDGVAVRDDSGKVASLGTAPVVVMAGLNADPFDGEALKDSLAALLTHPRIVDPGPESTGGIAVGTGAANDLHVGPPSMDTADWRDDPGPGNLRVDYVLPDAAMEILGSGVLWPVEGEPLHEEVQASDHRLVWVDIDLR